MIKSTSPFQEQRDEFEFAIWTENLVADLKGRGLGCAEWSPVVPGSGDRGEA